MCVPADGGQMSTLAVLLLCPSYYFFRQGLSLYLEFTDWSRLDDWPTRPKNPPACFPSAGIKGVFHHTWLVYVSARTRTEEVLTLLCQLPYWQSCAPGPLLSFLAFVFLCNIIHTTEIHRPSEQCYMVRGCPSWQPMTTVHQLSLIPFYTTVCGESGFIYCFSKRGLWNTEKESWKRRMCPLQFKYLLFQADNLH